MRILAAVLTAAALAACSGGPTDADAALEKRGGLVSCNDPAPLNGTPDPRTAGSYIVVFEDSVNAAAATARMAQTYGFQPAHVYEHALKGFAARLEDPQLAGVRCEPETRYVSHDGVVSIGG
jgi:hypothetical protein